MSPPSENSAQDSGSPPPRWAMKAMTRTHVFLHRLTGGRFFNSLAGDEVCFVTMKGARSGRTLTIPLMYVPYPEDAEGDARGVLLVASQGGAPRHPVWYHNLVKHPDIEVEHRGHRMKLRARLARPEEKDALWPVCDRHYAPFARYRKRTDRDIPIFVCEPRQG